MEGQRSTRGSRQQAASDGRPETVPVAAAAAAKVGLLAVGLAAVGFAVREGLQRAFAKSLRGDVALITGGGTGLGREIALLLAAEGCDLVLWGRREAPLLAVKEEAAAAATAAGFESLSVRVASVDISDHSAVAAAAEELLGGGGRVDILVSNAGIHLGPDPLERSAPPVFERTGPFVSNSHPSHPSPS